MNVRDATASATAQIFIDAALAIVNDPEWGRGESWRPGTEAYRLNAAHTLLYRAQSHLGIRAEYRESTTEALMACGECDGTGEVIGAYGESMVECPACGEAKC